MAKPRVQLKIENFGPIVEGTVEFKPLTLLIGPNNSGKSYVATLLYALSRVLRASPTYPFEPWVSEIMSDLFEIVAQESMGDVRELAVEKLSPSARDQLTEYLAVQTSYISGRIEEGLRQYFSVGDLSRLARADGDGKTSLRIVSATSTGDDVLLSVEGTSSGFTIDLDRRLPERIEFAPNRLLTRILQEKEAGSDAWAFILAERLFWNQLLKERGFVHDHVYYLPAARSGILTSWPMLASLAVRSVSRVLGRQQVDIAPLPGVIGDFLEDVIGRFSPVAGANGRDRERAALQQVLDIVEGQLLRGRVIIEERQPFAGELIYESEGLRLPLQRTSSMVGELAPVDLWVRELLEPGDLLIIDEPESHLHPENQRLIARALVRLVNAGVDVVAPTHSSTILHQVSNLLLASRADDATRAKLELTEADRIALDDVAVYLFEREADGIHIKEVPIDPEFGISEEEFVRVSEAIGEETLQLEFAAAQ